MDIGKSRYIGFRGLDGRSVMTELGIGRFALQSEIGTGPQSYTKIIWLMLLRVLYKYFRPEVAHKGKWIRENLRFDFFNMAFQSAFQQHRAVKAGNSGRML